MRTYKEVDMAMTAKAKAAQSARAKRSWKNGPLGRYWAKRANRIKHSVMCADSWEDGPLSGYREVLKSGRRKAA